MQLKINGENVDITLEDEKTVGQVLKAFEEEAAKNSATTTNINLDGKDISADEFDTILDLPLKDDTVIDLTVVSEIALAENFRMSAENFNGLQKKLSEISFLLQSGKDSEAGKIIAFLADEIDIFLHTSRLARLFPTLYAKVSIDGKDVNAFFEEFMPFLKDLEEALENKDTVTVGDLAEYEISPRLKQIADSLQGI